MKTTRSTTWTAALATGAAALVLACGSERRASDRGPGAAAGSGAATSANDPWAASQEAPAAPPAAARAQAQLEVATEELEQANLDGKVGLARGGGRWKDVADKQPPADDGDGAGDRGAEDSTRSWFPETFLFEPLVVTDATGAAVVPVRVPDRLTTWRVLALGHSRAGAQGGAVTSFLSTLPTYVDAVVPGQLQRGDRVSLPIQLVNTTDLPVATALSVTATNATLTGGGGARTIPARGSLVERVVLTADRPGRIELTLALRGGDAVKRTIDVLPVGKPVQTTRSGTLAAPRTLAITAPPGSDPATDRVRLHVFPGALALLRRELAVCTARSGVADDAYALYLGGRATALLTALGG